MSSVTKPRGLCFAVTGERHPAASRVPLMVDDAGKQHHCGLVLQWEGYTLFQNGFYLSRAISFVSPFTFDANMVCE